MMINRQIKLVDLVMNRKVWLATQNLVTVIETDSNHAMSTAVVIRFLVTTSLYRK